MIARTAPTTPYLDRIRRPLDQTSHEGEVRVDTSIHEELEDLARRYL